MDFFDVIRSRRSVRKYSGAPVEPGKLELVLDSGILAPTAKNIQPFRIFAIDAAKNRDALSGVYRGAWILDAPVVIAIASDPARAWKRGSDGKSSSDMDAAIAMDHMVLAATALGLGTCWICAFEPGPLRALLGLEAPWEPIAMTPLGYALESPGARERRPRSDLVAFL
jgi:nitroreductase